MSVKTDKNRKRPATINISLPPELQDKIGKKCAVTYRSVSQYLRDLVVADLTRDGAINGGNGSVERKTA